ncbi:hypothetical protein P3T36_006442 [Kitasatospora sp. MAP12-15]|uniref:hypothetical protein n=1 Tax=unclassified Kitasatospora TaxID=2633591 RepID=UPI002475E1DD|nr:hypothetical protein [Kitasatospora sp. MAP12-44]MDH6107830.1 hypothetical protein [Kitasatospora sp. MAP12-44]
MTDRHEGSPRLTEHQVRAALDALGIEVPERVKELSRWSPELRLAFLLGLLWRTVGQARDAEIERTDQQDGAYMAGPNELDLGEDQVRRAYYEIRFAADRLIGLTGADNDNLAAHQDLVPFQLDPDECVDGRIWAARDAAEAAASLLAPRVKDPHSRTLPFTRDQLTSALYYLEQLEAAAATEAGQQ